MKCLPKRYFSHLSRAQMHAQAILSDAEYPLCIGVRVEEAKAMGTSLPPWIWDSTAPTPTSLASVVTVVGAAGSKRKTLRSSASACWRVWKDVCCSCPTGTSLLSLSAS